MDGRGGWIADGGLYCLLALFRLPMSPRSTIYNPRGYKRHFTNTGASYIFISPI